MIMWNFDQLITVIQGRVVAVAGASGGTKIITAVAQVLFRAFYLGQVPTPQLRN